MFSETKTYDVAKLAALDAWAESLYARLSAQPVQAVAEKHSSDWGVLPTENPRCASYHFSVVDPITGWRVDLTGKSAFYDWSDAELNGCYGGDMFVETARRAAKTVKLPKDDFWRSLPYRLSQHLANGNLAEWRRPRMAYFQLFDDGWRIIDIAATKD